MIVFNNLDKLATFFNLFGMKYIYTIIFLSFISFTIAQSTFNKIINLQYRNVSMYDFLVHNDTLVGYGLTRANSTDLSTQGVLFVQLDADGDTLKTRIITDTTEDLLSISAFWGKIVATPDGGYAATTAPFVKNEAWLIKLDAELKTEFIKVYGDTVNLANFAYTPFVVEDGYILYGYTQGPDFYSDGFIGLVDKKGNRKWTNYDVNTTYYNDALDVGIYNDSLLVYISTNGLTPSGTAVHIYRSLISLIDYEGELQHTWQSEGNPEIGFLLELEVEEDGILLYGLYIAEYVGDVPLYQATLSKISRDLTEIYWVKHFGPKKTLVSDNGFFKIFPTKDGHYVGAGAVSYRPQGSNQTARYGWLYKFSSDGDLIWELKVPPPAEFDLGAWDEAASFYGVGVLPDSSIVASGILRDKDGLQFPWLVKVTNDGCLDTICPDIQTSTPSIVLETGLDIYPNPASDYIFIQHTEALRRIQLVDAIGQQIWLEQPYQGQYQLDLPANLENGIYFILAEDKTGQRFRQKVVVHR